MSRCFPSKLTRLIQALLLASVIVLIVSSISIAFSLPRSSSKEWGETVKNRQAAKEDVTTAADIAFYNDGKSIMTVHAPQRIHLWETQTGKLLKTLDGG